MTDCSLFYELSRNHDLLLGSMSREGVVSLSDSSVVFVSFFPIPHLSFALLFPAEFFDYFFYSVF